MIRRTAAVIAPLLLAAVACGGGPTGSAASNPSSSASAPASSSSAPPGSSGPAGSTAPSTTTTSAGQRPVPKPATQTAGPVSVSAQVCEVTGHELKGDTSAVESMAFTADHAFVVSDGKVLAFNIRANAQGCKLQLDTKLGTGGELETGSTPIDTVSATPTGVVVASGVLGTKVFDTTKGSAFDCDDITGNVIVHPSGAYAYRWFPGSPVKRVELSDTKCTLGADVPMPFAEAVFVAFDGEGVLVGGKNAEGVMTAARTTDGTVQWQHGNPVTSQEDALGWVHGMTACGDGFCVADTNFDRLQVLDATGKHRASFTVSKLLGLSKGFTKTMVMGPENAPYVLNSVQAGGTTFGFIARIQATG